MAVYCPACGRQYDITLFGFGRTIVCDCGAVVSAGGAAAEESAADGAGPTEPFKVPIDGVLDLHAFAPADAGELVPEYLAACREKGLHRVRIIHGKGIGEMMKTVRAILKRLPEVESFETAGPGEGGSGATIVRLRPDE